jgi:7-carboxy-7-deazaguanine synthase
MRICEHFRSLQGEGLLIGVPTYFIRTAGCNLDCSWCDTVYAREEPGIEFSAGEVMELVGDAADVCVTGGEPLLQEDMPELLERLLESGRRVVLETNGSVDLSGVPDHPRLIISMDIKCPSSGMEARMHLPNLRMLTAKDQLKFVIADKQDLYHAIRFLEENATAANVIFTPAGGTDLESLADEVVMRRLDVRVLPQLHKVIWGERRSV